MRHTSPLKIRHFFPIVAAAVSLAACAGTSSVPPSPSYAELAGRLQPVAAAEGTPSPCAIPHGWRFEGPCKEFDLPSTPGPTIKFPRYRGLRVITHIGTTTSDGQPFVLGLGTGDADITGRDYGVFPEFGHAPGGCYTYYHKAIKCKGTAFAYVLLYVPPTNSWATGLASTPWYRIEAAAFPGTRCRQAVLGALGGRTWVWQDLPQIARPKRGAVTFKPFEWILSLAEGYFEVVAFHCY